MRPVVAKGQIMLRGSTVEEENICRLTLTENQLLIEQDEFGKQLLPLYRLPLEQIQEFVLLYRAPRKGLGIRGVLNELVTSKTHPLELEKEDMIRLSFYHFGKSEKITFKMLDLGENGITTAFAKLVKKRKKATLL